MLSTTHKIDYNYRNNFDICYKNMHHSLETNEIYIFCNSRPITITILLVVYFDKFVITITSWLIMNCFPLF